MKPWRSVRVFLSMICLGWIVLVTALYFCTLDGEFILDLFEHSPLTLILVCWAVEWAVVPTMLILMAHDDWWAGHRGLDYWLVVGCVCGLYANSALLTIPYMGLYLNIPAAVGWWLLGVSEKSFYLGTAITNLVLWPGAGYLVYWFGQRRRHDTR